MAGGEGILFSPAYWVAISGPSPTVRISQKIDSYVQL